MPLLEEAVGEGVETVGVETIQGEYVGFSIGFVELIELARALRGARTMLLRYVVPSLTSGVERRLRELFEMSIANWKTQPELQLETTVQETEGALWMRVWGRVEDNIYSYVNWGTQDHLWNPHNTFINPRTGNVQSMQIAVLPDFFTPASRPGTLRSPGPYTEFGGPNFINNPLLVVGGIQARRFDELIERQLAPAGARLLVETFIPKWLRASGFADAEIYEAQAEAAQQASWLGGDFITG